MYAITYSFSLVDTAPSPILFDDPSRKKIYRKIEDNALMDARYIAHFLIPYEKVVEQYMDNPNNTKKALHEVLKRWDWLTPEPSRTWNNLKAILIFLSHRKLVMEIEGSEKILENVFTVSI